MKALDFLLSDEPVKQEDRTIVRRAGDKLDDLQITQYAVDRAFTYAKLVCEITKQDNECIGYLITPKDAKDRIARDVYFPKDQEVDSGFVEISPQQVIASGREIDQMGYRVLGWWHSHASLETFHSGIDAKNQMTVLNAIAPVNYITKINEKIIGNGNLEVVVEGGKVIIFDKKNKGIKYEISTDNASGLAIAGMKVIEEERVGFAYSLVVHNTAERQRGFFGNRYSSPASTPKTVVSPAVTPATTITPPIKGNEDGIFPFEGIVEKGLAKVERMFEPSYGARHLSEEEIEMRKGLETRERHPYAEVAKRTFCTGCKELADVSEKVKLNIKPETRPLDETQMKKDIEERIKKRRTFSFPGFGGYKSYSGSYKGSRSKSGFGSSYMDDFDREDEFVGPVLPRKTTPVIPYSPELSKHASPALVELNKKTKKARKQKKQEVPAVVVAPQAVAPMPEVTKEEIQKYLREGRLTFDQHLYDCGHYSYYEKIIAREKQAEQSRTKLLTEEQ